MTNQDIVITLALSAIVSATVAISRTRNPIAWFFIGAAFPIMSVLLLAVMEPLGPDGKLLPRCCAKCPCKSRHAA